MGYLGPIGLGNGPYVLGNGPYVLGNGLHGLGNGPHGLGIMSQFKIMLHSVLCRIRDYVAVGIMSFGIRSLGIMSH